MLASCLNKDFFFQYEEMSRNETPILMALCGDQKDQWSQVRSPNSQQILAFLMNEGQDMHCSWSENLKNQKIKESQERVLVISNFS